MPLRLLFNERISWTVAMTVSFALVASPCLGQNKRAPVDACVVKILGEGLGGIVRLMRSTTGAEFGSKLYADEIKFNRDYTLLTRLRRYVHSESDPKGFRIVRVRKGIRTHDGHFEMIEDMEHGEDLHSLLLNPNIPKKEKRRLKSLYLENLRIFDARLGKNGLLKKEELTYASAFFKDKEFDGLPVRTYAVLGRADDEPETAILKSDNVLVNRQTGRMTIIDPY